MLPVTPNVLPMVALLLTVNALTVLLPLTLSVVNIAVLGAALPIGVDCRPPSKSPGPLAVNEPVNVIPFPLILPVTPNVDPMVVELLTVKALTVALALPLTVVN